MNDRNYRQTNFSTVLNYKGCKRLGTYLIEAKLISPAQIQVALNDQQDTGYRLGDILVLRGWIKRELVEWIVQHHLLPERNIIKRNIPGSDSSHPTLNTKDYDLFEADTVVVKNPTAELQQYNQAYSSAEEDSTYYCA